MGLYFTGRQERNGWRRNAGGETGLDGSIRFFGPAFWGRLFGAGFGAGVDRPCQPIRFLRPVLGPVLTSDRVLGSVWGPVLGQLFGGGMRGTIPKPRPPWVPASGGERGGQEHKD